ncbi:MAG: hypothetical protein R2744_11270 [Bacteroidales bacterium]
MSKVNAAANELVGAGYLLGEDIPYLLQKAEERWKWVMGRIKDKR